MPSMLTRHMLSPHPILHFLLLRLEVLEKSSHILADPIRLFLLHLLSCSTKTYLIWFFLDFCSSSRPLLVGPWWGSRLVECQVPPLPHTLHPCTCPSKWDKHTHFHRQKKKQLKHGQHPELSRLKDSKAIPLQEGRRERWRHYWEEIK